MLDEYDFSNARPNRHAIDAQDARLNLDYPRRRRRDTLVSTLRKEFGNDFLREFLGEATLGEVLDLTGDASLSDLVNRLRALR